jgi:hypothetical protein
MASAMAPSSATLGMTMAYNKQQWISSFEDKLTTLRPHLTLRMLGQFSLSAWFSHGADGIDPVTAAKEESERLDMKSLSTLAWRTLHHQVCSHHRIRPFVDELREIVSIPWMTMQAPEIRRTRE